MGVVYEALDGVRGIPVALKTLSNVGPGDVYFLKQEFRSLAGVGHDNLVTLYELFVEPDCCFFTMELVRGVDFLTYVRGGATLAYDDTVESPTRAKSSLRAPAPTRARYFDEVRLRRCLCQLAGGIHAIHRAGKLHCDLKPSNVLVTTEGRLVVLDFGLVAEQDAGLSRDREHFGGTPAYMAPEQGLRGVATPASDWYAFGAMLYEALTGAVPFEGHPARMLAAKADRDADPPSSLVAGLPRDLERLCTELLSRRAEDRPDAEHVLAALQLSGVRPVASRTSAPPSSTDHTLFVGRQRELETIAAAYDDALRGTAVVALVHGPSGIGKTALVSRFLRTVRRDTVVLRGKCYESESVPFKALDSVVDALCRHLINLRQDAARELLPDDIGGLTRLFPVLRRIPALSSLELLPDDGEPRAQRRRAVAALKELLGRIAAIAPLVMFVDDLQWGDEDSAHLLSELLVPSGDIRWLLIGAYRSDEREASAFLRTFTEATSERIGPRQIILGPLDVNDARALARDLLPLERAPTSSNVHSIARESGGSPFFIAELARHEAELDVAVGDGANRDVSLERALLRRIDSFSAPARTFLELCSVAGRPIDERVVIEAAAIGEPYAAIAALKAGKLIRGVGPDGHIETYHDRIRQAVAANIETRRLRVFHSRLAAALESRPDSDPEMLAEHFKSGGELGKARLYARDAAGRAAAALAFDRSARLYRLALSLEPSESTENRALSILLGEALSSAGRGREAAEAFLAATVAAPLTELSDLRRRAAEQLLRSGFIDEGMDVLRESLREIGVEMPASGDDLRRESRKLSQRLRDRGFGFEVRSSGDMSITAIRRIDVFWSAALGLATIDGARAELMAFHHLLEALDAGDPRLVLRGLALHVVTSGARPGSRRIAALLEHIEAIAAGIGDSDAFGWASYAKGVAAFWQGRPASCLTNIGAAEAHWRTTEGGRARELSMAKMAMHLSLTLVGAIEELTRCAPEWVREANDRDDLYLSTMLRAYRWTESLAADRPERALEEARDAMRRWGRKDFDVLEWEASTTRVQVSLYRGAPEAAWTEISRIWDAILESNIGMATQFRALSFDTWGRAALGVAATKDDPAPWLAHAEAAATELESLGLPCFATNVLLLRAGVHAVRRDIETAISLLRQSAAPLDGAEERNPLTARVADRQRGLLEGVLGEPVVRRAEDALRTLGIANPAAWCALYAPGFVSPEVAGR